ncbi:FAD-dependent thymidylate synthase [Dactylosporangium sp. NPDC000244]|uniref:FAD-dependent thymidylate synthase n=1 Tax=Dactylosporangium sp. NPDC000244 TaxID=3154365 RepID=UPI00332F9AD3
MALRAHAIAWTHFEPPSEVPWETDAEGGEALAEFAGRACYQSWSKPNPATATNAGYLKHILEVGHLSVLEHGTVTFYLTGVSRSFTHEVVRHRHFSYSQLSQRYVADGGEVVVPPLFAGDQEAGDILDSINVEITAAYDALMARANRLLEGRGLVKTDRHKQARQAARAVLPNMAETRIVVTGNYRAWRHFVTMRATEAADIEIREVAVACLRELQRVAPSVFGDFTISELADGTEVASSPYAERS